DGRARSPEEAILWHGGEAERSREIFRNMAREDREALIYFLRTL
ncbi:MAG TPA: thiol oxidoreductase, partial [Synechococcus sp. M44_DOE_062]|nr:thiol oxidoreductase [Synechococcus sp. M44_DOE_062]